MTEGPRYDAAVALIRRVARFVATERSDRMLDLPHYVEAIARCRELPGIAEHLGEPHRAAFANDPPPPPIPADHPAMLQFQKSPSVKLLEQLLLGIAGVVRFPSFLQSLEIVVDMHGSPDLQRRLGMRPLETPPLDEFLDEEDEEDELDEEPDDVPSALEAALGNLPRAGALLRRHSQLADALRERLGRDVVGQWDAVRMMAKHYRTSLRLSKRAGVRGIFTFLGPPGVGKTMLAQRFAAALSEVEGVHYGCFTFPMETSDREGTLFNIFGTPKAYGTAHEGKLLELITANPRQVLVFDEIEKAPEAVIQSLLTLLESGKTRDNCKLVEVDASQCWVVFTTNLGGEFLGSLNRSGVLSGGRVGDDEIFDALERARRRQEQGSDFAPPALSPEFVSRLRRGGAVLFRSLSGHSYTQLLQRTLSGAAQLGDGSFPVVEATDDATLLILLTLLPRLTPRRVAAEGLRIADELVEEAVARCRPLAEADPDGFTMRLVADGPAQARLQEERRNAQVRILVADDDARLKEWLARELPRVLADGWSGGACSVEHVAPADFDARLFEPPADLLFLDIDAPHLDALARLEQVRAAWPDAAVVLHGTEPGSREVVQRALQVGGARAFIVLDGTGDALVPSSAELVEVVRDVFDEAVFRQRERANAKLSYGVTYEFDAAANTVTARLNVTGDRRLLPMVDPGQIAPAPKPDVTFEDVFGNDRAKERLRMALDLLKDPRPLRPFRLRPPSGYLLAGPPGTGKTMLAQAAANYGNMTFFALAASELTSKWVGHGEERIRALFDTARRHAPAVVFLDEIDAIGKRRGSSPNGHYEEKLLTQLLASIDGFGRGAPVLLLAATNIPDELDPALTRPGRFDETIRLRAPEAVDRRRMIEGKLAQQPCAPSVRAGVDQVVARTGGLSFAQLDRVLREAGYLAAAAGRGELVMEDIDRAVTLVRYGGEDRTLAVPEDQKVRTAWHEAGHVVARLKLTPSVRVDYATIVPTEDGALGFAAGWSEARETRTLEDFLNEIAVCLAGREAEALMPEGREAAINTGASSDLQHATQLAVGAVGAYGLLLDRPPLVSAVLPPALEAQQAAQDLGRVAALLERGRDRARAALSANSLLLACIAEALVRQETLSHQQLIPLVENS